MMDRNKNNFFILFVFCFSMAFPYEFVEHMLNNHLSIHERWNAI